MKRSLLKLIEISILPAIVLMLAKFGGIYFSAALFNINLNLEAQSGSLVFFQTTVKSSDLILVSSYSDLFMFLAIAIGMSIILIQALYLHDSHISSNTINKLAKYNLLSMMRSSWELYHGGVIWLVFLYIANIIILINCTRGLTQLWALLVATIFSLSYSIIFFKDLYAEIELSKNHETNPKY
jgi:hypothetical protein